MSRHVNSQYNQFKRQLQNRFAERYARTNSTGYTEQDAEYAKLAGPKAPKPIIPDPIIPKARRFRKINRIQENKVQSNIDQFEKEYQEFINSLRAKKQAEQSIPEPQEEPAEPIETESETETEE